MIHVKRLVTCGVVVIATLKAGTTTNASDHADPIDPLYRQRQEGAITDLFVFPVRELAQPASRYSDVIAHPFRRKHHLPLHDPLADVRRTPLTQEQMGEIDALVFILCVRRELTDSGKLNLTPYQYRIHIDVDSPVIFPEEGPDAMITTRDNASKDNDKNHRHSHQDPTPGLSPLQSFARYGGKIAKPNGIREDITMHVRLDNLANISELSFSGSAASAWNREIVTHDSGIFDDPFIFISFFGTNVVGIAFKVPMKLFPSDKSDFLIWATSHKGRRQMDHVGRSGRTQNPRFEQLNTLHPSKHKAAIEQEHQNPSLMRDLFLRANLGSLFAFRKWDFVPDVMCYSTRYPVGFPNGRLLTDDVAAILAQHGDTLLYELSYQDNQGTWPRQTVNDTSASDTIPGEFNPSFPYLNTPFPDRQQPSPTRLSWQSIGKLTAIGIVLVMLFLLENYVVARLYHRKKEKQKYVL